MKVLLVVLMLALASNVKSIDWNGVDYLEGNNESLLAKDPKIEVNGEQNINNKEVDKAQEDKAEVAEVSKNAETAKQDKVEADEDKKEDKPGKKPLKDAETDKQDKADADKDKKADEKEDKPKVVEEDKPLKKANVNKEDNVQPGANKKEDEKEDKPKNDKAINGKENKDKKLNNAKDDKKTEAETSKDIADSDLASLELNNPDTNEEEVDVFYVMGSMTDFYQLMKVMYLFRYLNQGYPSDRDSPRGGEGGYNSDRLEMVLSPVEQDAWSSYQFENQLNSIKSQNLERHNTFSDSATADALTLEDSFSNVVNKARNGLNELKEKLQDSLRRRSSHDLVLMALLGTSVLLVLANIFECLFLSDKRNGFQSQADYYRLKEEPYNPVLPTYEECVKSDKAYLAHLHENRQDERLCVYMEEKKGIPEN